MRALHQRKTSSLRKKGADGSSRAHGRAVRADWAPWLFFGLDWFCSPLKTTRGRITTVALEPTEVAETILPPPKLPDLDLAAILGSTLPYTTISSVWDGAVVEYGIAAHKAEPASRDSLSGDGDQHTSGGQKPPRRRVLPFIGTPLVLMDVVLPWDYKVVMTRESFTMVSSVPEAGGVLRAVGKEVLAVRHPYSSCATAAWETMGGTAQRRKRLCSLFNTENVSIRVGEEWLVLTPADKLGLSYVIQAQDLNSIHEEGQLEEEMQDLNSIHEEGQFEKERQNLNSIHEEGQLEEKMEFLCNVEEEYAPRLG
ncbi:hypothetical protein PIB30_037810 [Stylosanthes scabra]|uniref:Uncharacterized protein n=1 Tax=Stylosanthes scabra TaxID=79078 RepID=A0ABU6QE55_9FABA|nr:hypothetical protein [Stylosanthes scabra]